MTSENNNFPEKRLVAYFFLFEKNIVSPVDKGAKDYRIKVIKYKVMLQLNASFIK